MAAFTPRQLAEIQHHAKYEWPFDTWKLDELVLPLNYREFLRHLDDVYFASRDADGCKVLECGCGFGVVSVTLARRGAQVEAFDICPQFVEATERLIRENDVTGRVNVKQATMEKLEYPDASFDLVVGMNVLHHVEIAQAAPEIPRVLKPGGMAVFTEPVSPNALREAVRRCYRSLPLIAKRGTETEHPVTREELQHLSDAVGGRMTHKAGPFSFFSHLVAILLVSKKAWAVRRAATGLDRAVDRVLPFLRAFSTDHMLVMEKQGA